MPPLILYSTPSVVTLKPCLAQKSVSAQGHYAEVATQIQKLAEYEITERRLPGLSIALVDDQQIVSGPIPG